MRFHLIGLFPESIDSYIGSSIIKRAIEDKKIAVYTYNPKDFGDEAGARIDKKPYGGGPGMVLQAMPIMCALEKAFKKISSFKKVRPVVKVIFFKPRADVFTGTAASSYAKKYTDIVMIAGRYEGIDARISKMIKDTWSVKVDSLSVGDFVLTGGELPAMILIDAIARQVEGVLGDFDSREETRIASGDVYTRPEVILWKNKKYKVPKVLVGGNHKAIDEWRAKHSE